VTGGSFEELLAEVVAAIVALRAEAEAVRDELAALKSLLGADSSTNSRPPSGEPVAAPEKRAERCAEELAAKRAQGEQPGAPGRSLQQRRPDRLIEHGAPACSCKGADLSAAAVVGTEVRQVIDLPQLTPTLSDHIVGERRCGCGTGTAAAMPPEARAPRSWDPELRTFPQYLLDGQHLPVGRTAELRATLVVAFALLPAGTPPRRRHRGGWNHAQRKAFDLATRRPNNHDQVLRLLATPRSGPPTTTPSAHYPRSRSTTRPPAPSNQPREPPAPPPGAPTSKPPNTHCHNLPDARRQPFTTRPRSPPPAAVIT